MVNLTALNNINPLELNQTIITNGSLIENLGSNFATNQPYWLFPVTLLLFITLVVFIYKKLDWGLDIVQTSLIASFIQILFSYAIIKIGWSINVTPLAFWGAIWMILLIAMTYIKKR